MRKTAELQKKYPVAYSRALAELMGPIVNEMLNFVRYYALPEFKQQMVHELQESRIEGKTNFFEKRVGEYALAEVGENVEIFGDEDALF